MLVYYVLKRNQIKHYCSDIIRSMADSQAYCLRRKNHSSDLIDVFDRMFKDESMTDVSLMCTDGTIKAHRMVLSACSPYFKTLFDKMPNNYNYYPIVILKDMPINDLRAIIEFIYRGEVTVAQEQLESVIRNGESLHIKGLVDIEDNKEKDLNNKTTISRRRKRRRHRRKSALDENKNNNEDDEEEDINNDRINSSDDYVSEYSDGDETSHSLIGTATDVNLSRNYNESVGASEGDIEPSRLLEQSMITGDTQESNSIHHYSSSSNAHQMSAVDEDDVKPILYDEPIGLISQISSGLATHSLTHDMHSESAHNHSAHVSTASTLTYDTSGIQSIPGTSCSQIGVRSHSSNEKRKHKSTAKKSLHSRLQSQSFHARQQRFHCHICHQGFTAKRNLQRHMQIHNYYRNKFECEVCQRQFSWKHTLNIHKEKAHNIKL